MNARKLRDIIGTNLMRIVTLFIPFLFFFILILLLYKSTLVLGTHSITDVLFSTIWNPDNDQFGLAAVIIDTILVTGIALIAAIPISLLSAVYIVEYAPLKLRRTIRPFIDVLAGVPSVVYGLCAFLFLAPFVKNVIAPWFGVQTTGLCFSNHYILMHRIIRCGTPLLERSLTIYRGDKMGDDKKSRFSCFSTKYHGCDTPRFRKGFWGNYRCQHGYWWNHATSIVSIQPW
jgi:ABC-type phosphate transport system permease subunit